MAKNTLGLVFFPAFDWMISLVTPNGRSACYIRATSWRRRDCSIARRLRNIARGWLKSRICSVRTSAYRAIARLITPAHLTSAGGCLVAADAVMQREVQRAFALVRPPGHHAMRVVHGIRGFCTINIEAIMVEYLRSRYNIRRIAVVDTDVHHGDGSQDVFYHDPDTLYISFHQDGRTLYPGTGFPNEAGSPAAWGTNINLPLLPGTGDEGLHRLYDGLITHILEDFQPELIINSAGQDNHFSDPLASMQVTAQGYARLADKLQADIAVLEGGYSIESALPYVNTGIILAMAGMDYSKVVEPDLRGLRPQDERCNKRVDQLIAEVGDLYFNRERTSKELLKKCGNTWQRSKHIYYDEEGIREEQVESVHYCERKACRGYFTLQTAAEGTRFGDQNCFHYLPDARNLSALPAKGLRCSAGRKEARPLAVCAGAGYCHRYSRKSINNKH